MKKIDMYTYRRNPEQYELRNGLSANAPNCPYGNKFRWIGYDLESKEYVRFTKSIFKLLIQKNKRNA